MLAVHDREHAEDHHFEPIHYRRDIIKTKHATRKNKKKRRRQLTNLIRTSSSGSIDGSRVDGVERQSVLDENDEVPDVPIPISSFPDDYSLKGSGDDIVAIPMEEMARLRSAEEGMGVGDLRSDDRSPLSPKITVFGTVSKETDV